jgi:capsular polysaccharide biosynthesis protein
MKGSDFINVVMKRIWILILSIIICISLVNIYSYFFMTKQYEATSTVYVLRKDNNPNPSTNLNSELLASLSLIKDYLDLIKSKVILQRVKTKLEEQYPWAKEMRISEISSQLNIQNKNDKHILSISVKHQDPEKASIIANQVVDEFQKFSKEITSEDTVTLIDKAEASMIPVQPKPVVYTFLAFVIGVLIGLLTIFLHYFLSIASRSNRTNRKRLVFSDISN